MSPPRQFPRTEPVDLIADESAYTPLRRSPGLLPLVPLSVGTTLGTGPRRPSAVGVRSAAGLVVYFAYGRRRSELARSRFGSEQPAQGE
ncbi:hypothetical protein [Saccharothrix deserti]|uniref:hypothetical protein n=1 Tax=Saccharothrix deserti TaxID=2593674 RepID=UPI00131D5793|nr:hypothetical protein [Saccharothrix deserti]